MRVRGDLPSGGADSASRFMVMFLAGLLAATIFALLGLVYVLVRLAPI